MEYDFSTFAMGTEEVSKLLNRNKWFPLVKKSDVVKIIWKVSNDLADKFSVIKDEQKKEYFGRKAKLKMEYENLKEVQLRTTSSIIELQRKKMLEHSKNAFCDAVCDKRYRTCGKSGCGRLYRYTKSLTETTDEFLSNEFQYCLSKEEKELWGKVVRNESTKTENS